jgi:hypothetical protein
MRKFSRGFGFLVVAAGMAVALTLAGGPAYADPDKPGPSTALPAEPVPGGFRSWSELIDTQEQLRAAAQRLDDAAARETGFTGIEAAPENRRVRLFWNGELPDSVARLVDEISREVPVEVVPARHSLAELEEQQAAIAQEDGVNGVGPQVDGSGLIVRFRGSEEEARALPAIRAATVPLTIEPFDTTAPVSCTGRQDDCSPYWGGAKYVMPSGGWCTMGFSLKFTSYLLPYSSSTWTRMLSAGHCSSDGTAIVDGGGDTFGTVTGDYDTQDILTISPAAGVTLGGRVYVGPWNSGIPSNKAVAGTAASFVGQWVCPSGAATGEHCNVKVTAVNFTIWGTVKTVVAKEQSGGVAVGKGDSGGPVITYNLSGKVNANGTISAGSNQVACPSGSPSSMCFNTIYYVDILTSLAHYKPMFGTVSVMTS